MGDFHVNMIFFLESNTIFFFYDWTKWGDVKPNTTSVVITKFEHKSKALIFSFPL